MNKYRNNFKYYLFCCGYEEILKTFFWNFNEICGEMRRIFVQIFKHFDGNFVLFLGKFLEKLEKSCGENVQLLKILGWICDIKNLEKILFLISSRRTIFMISIGGCRICRKSKSYNIQNFAFNCRFFEPFKRIYDCRKRNYFDYFQLFCCFFRFSYWTAPKNNNVLKLLRVFAFLFLNFKCINYCIFWNSKFTF